MTGVCRSTSTTGAGGEIADHLRRGAVDWLLENGLLENAGSIGIEAFALPLTDFVIATAASCSGHELWSFDGDFARPPGAA